ncbi:TPA: restriction endonuclease subunit S [Staphylococcus aureus]|uniref:Restriction endonuclease subunit S n=8 Tax=Staphylococcus aureus TaxID=1280 RepID=A0A2S6DG38_STAAU|nr:restriction endonuclease subunit S [Staphylococcus aureus]HDH6210794.1 restriction endonuclease subunit S [Staphylococcus aureus LTCF-12-55]HDH6225349.1 restriction endonuclease subunit S [Staphylococcus aureus LTCF-12-46]HDH6264449.1 restriction endonuclease subunit S [Staphylococcus aureus LTCF-7-30]HDH6421705.1 restriction endonuclease subunit S [Staphylococcus aureus MRSA-Lux-33]HDH6424024.1 restriction endonuclease subunit S [Staphylococcus aureus MRSA-Lux-34]HDH6427007.1 restriction 
MSNTQKKNVPELRFPGFEGEWEEKKLGEFAGKVTQKNVDKKYIETLTNSAELGIISQKDYFDKEISNIDNIKKYYVVEENDFVYNPRMSNYAPFGPVNRNKLGKKGVMSPLYTVFKIQNIDLNFIEFYFKSSKWYRFMALNGDSGARADRFSIKDRTFMEMPLHIPCMDEQIKIGQFFSKLDRQIELEEQKLELLQQQKKGYMQKIFSQELRFKDENGKDYPEWEETTIKEIAQINTGKKDTKDAITNGSYDFYVRSPIVYKINTFSYEGEAILTVGDGVGVGKVFHYVNGKFDYHQRVYKISDFKNYYGLLLFYYFSQNFLKETKKYSAKTSVDSVRKDMIANMKVPRPIYIEQKKIGQFIKRVDNKTKIQKQVIELLKQRKKSLLQKMFI